jgi:hypothetical protein
MTSRIFLFGLSLALASILTVFAKGASERTQEDAHEIDRILSTHQQAHGVKANPPIPDESFLRRIYLDLAGRIPTSEEAETFLKSGSSQKRSELIAELLSRESYVSHFFNFWADVLRLKSFFVNTANVVPAAYARWLKQSLRDNKPYDQFVRELLSARGYCWENGAVGYYMRDLEMPLENMALTTRVFLGTRIECAQCHDHPFDKWKQTEFYHLAAYTYGNKFIHEELVGVRDAFRARENAILEDFKKEKSASTDGGKAAEERKKQRLDAIELRPVLNIIRGGIGQLLSPIALDRKPEAVLALPFDFHQSDGKPGDRMSPKPIFGTAKEPGPGDDKTEIFAHWATASENPAFTRVIVNRLWKKLFGVALIEPLDELTDQSEALVPELEDHLVKLMVRLGYDMRAFLTIVANTRAYQSAVQSEEFSRGRRWHFQGPALRRMSAEQVWDSMVTLTNPEPDMRDRKREKREDRRIEISHMIRDAYRNYDGAALVELGYKHLAEEKARHAEETAIREAEIAAKRRGDGARVTELRRELGKSNRLRGESYVKEFMMPLLENLAHRNGGAEAKPIVDETYQMNSNPAVFAVETWRRMWVPGYGPAPRTREQLETENREERERLTSLASKLGYAEIDHRGFVEYAERAQSEWLRASELESPAPRGHFLRTMGQSDRDFVENANPNASIPQALALMNSDVVGPGGVFAPYSPVMRSVSRAGDKTDAIYLALLSRYPTTTERESLSKAAPSPEALIYALLNSKKFLFLP